MTVYASIDVQQIHSKNGLYFNILESRDHIGVWTNCWHTPVALLEDKEHHAVFFRSFKDSQALDNYLTLAADVGYSRLVWRSDK